MTTVELFINSTSVVGDIGFALLGTQAGVPLQGASGRLLQLTIPEGAVPRDPPNPTGFYALDLTSFGVSVSAGDVLAFQLFGIEGNYAFGGQADNPYTAGHFFERRTDQSLVWQAPSVAPNADMAFRTYVEPASVPEPTSLFLVGVGVGLIGMCQMTHRRRG